MTMSDRERISAVGMGVEPELLEKAEARRVVAEALGVDERTLMNRAERVREFMDAMEQPARETPGLPTAPHPAGSPENWIRLRAALVLEEAFELAEALFDSRVVKTVSGENPSVIDIYKREAKRLCMESALKKDIDLVAVADALEDMDYVVEGARVTFGLQHVADEIADAVHAANMRKLGGGKDPKTGKRLKPPGWVGPEAEIEALIEHAKTRDTERPR